MADQPPCTITAQECGRQYRAVLGSLHQVSATQFLLVSSELAAPVVLSRRLRDALGRCVGCRTITEHAAAVAPIAEGGDSPVHALNELLRLGVIREHISDGGTNFERQKNPSPVTTVGIVTCDRPELLRRCLSSLIEHCRHHGRTPRILVVDGSLRRQNSSRARQYVDEFRRKHANQVIYVGIREKAQLIERLTGEGAPLCSAAFGLDDPQLLHATGGNRNVLMLLTAGENLISIDDDVIVSPVQSMCRNSGTSFSGHEDPRATMFFDSRREAFDSVQPCDEDLIGAHEQLLGWPVSVLHDRALGDADTTRACHELWAAIVQSDSRSLVRLTAAGVAGDAGVYCPYRRLFGSQQMRSSLLSSPATLARALRTREVVQIASRTSVVHRAACMAYCMGADNGTMLPPFMPRFRNQDGVFGLTLQLCDPAAFFGHLSMGVIHDSVRPSMYERHLASATQTRLSELLVALSSACPLDANEPKRRLEQLGAELIRLSEADNHDFLAAAAHHIAVLRARDYEKVATFKAPQPGFWREAVEAYHAELTTRMQDPRFFIPIECRGDAHFDDQVAQTKNAIRTVGRLYADWPAAWTVAKRLNVASYAL